MSGRIYSLQSPLVDTTRFASTWFEFLLMNGRYSCFSERNKKKHRSMTHCCLAKHTCTHSTRCQTSFATFELHGSYRGQYQQKKIKETCCYHDFAVISFLSGSRAIQKKSVVPFPAVRESYILEFTVDLYFALFLSAKMIFEQINKACLSKSNETAW